MKLPLFVASLLACTSIGFAESPAKTCITILPTFREQVNAEAPDDKIPWAHENEACDVKVRAKLTKECALVSVTNGDWTTTLHQFSFTIVKVQEGKWTELPKWGDRPVTFFLKHRLPTPESKIEIKELWPFLSDAELTFKLRKTPGRWQIVSIEP